MLNLLWQSSDARRKKRLADAEAGAAGQSQSPPYMGGAGGGGGATVAYFDPMKLNPSIQQLPNLGTQAGLIIEELQWPFADTRPAACRLSDARLYELTVGDVDESVRRGMLVPVKVSQVAYFDADHRGMQVRACMCVHACVCAGVGRFRGQPYVVQRHRLVLMLRFH